jgi:hypothetical protein
MTRSSFLFPVSCLVLPKDCHEEGRDTLTVKQSVAVKTAVKCAPLLTGSQVNANLKNFSPGKHVSSDRKSQAALNRLVRKNRKELMAARIPGINIDGTNGSMTLLVQSISLLRHIKKHTDPTDPYHLNEHQTFCLGY